MLDHLQPDALLNVAVYLPARDVLSLVSTNSSLQSLSANPEFWTTLQEQHYFSITHATTAAQAKHSYLLKAHCDSLESVRWHRIASTTHMIRPREGHLGCRLGNDNVITGGFVQDPGIYIQRPGELWQRLLPPQAPMWVYGATLTALPDGRRAVRFGGFASGGYQDETSNVRHVLMQAKLTSMVFRSLSCITMAMSTFTGSRFNTSPHRSQILVHGTGLRREHTHPRSFYLVATYL